MKIPFVSEGEIDEVSQLMDDEAISYDQLLVEMQDRQPILFSYLFSENFKLLTTEEKEYLLYLALIIWKAIAEQTEKAVPITSEIIEEKEEKNWTIFNESTARVFRDKLDYFFQEYPQEDLLAYVEDALVDDEDTFVTKEGRDLMFIGLKTMVDSLCGISV